MKFVKLFCAALLSISLNAVAEFQSPEGIFQQDKSVTVEEGIRFACDAARIGKVESAMDEYISSLGIAPELYVKSVDPDRGVLLYTLSTPKNDTNTLDFKDRPAFHIQEDTVTLPAQGGTLNTIQTVSKKEILLALMQHGRLTRFAGSACNIDALKDHVGIRQNTVAWAEHLSWEWPDGEYAEWNQKYWNKGTPKKGVSLHEAFNDVFLNQEKYSIGCYTATKLVIVQGVLDYYNRIKKSPAQLKIIENRLLKDQDPLVGIEPGKMWDFEKDFDPQDENRPGKLLKIKHDVLPMNFVPGDWVYFLNTDPVSSGKTGYEGSNAIYMGRNKFDDYYDDNNHSYTYTQKLDEVYQWRNGVFSRSRDFAKIRPLTPQDIVRLSKKPAEGGLLKSVRVYPYFFAYEELPVLIDP